MSKTYGKPTGRTLVTRQPIPVSWWVGRAFVALLTCGISLTWLPVSIAAKRRSLRAVTTEFSEAPPYAPGYAQPAPFIGDRRYWPETVAVPAGWTLDEPAIPAHRGGRGNAVIVYVGPMAPAA